MASIGPVDYIVPTWNSARTLDGCLASIEANGRPARILVVDNRSTDGTREIAKEHRCLIIDDEVSLGSARRKGLDAAMTEWIGFVDSDVVLCEGWFDSLSAQIDERTGAIHGEKLPVWEPFRTAHREHMVEVFSRGPLRKSPGGRGYTDNTLVRRELALRADIEGINAFEDFLITQEVLKAGYEWLHVPVFVDHHEGWETFLRKPGWHTAGLLWLLHRGEIGTRRFLRTFLLNHTGWYLLDGAQKAVRYRDGRLLTMRLAQLRYLWLGLVQSERMFRLERR
ncbi:MAG: glycosyltransferase family 2 protein [Thermoplasmata archaeon]|nr:glycosyltransferase family 2 protein [Thermoplasmata archaeon]